MEERISNYILSKTHGDLFSYRILINISLEMILDNQKEETIIKRIDQLLRIPKIKDN